MRGRLTLIFTLYTLHSTQGRADPAPTKIKLYTLNSKYRASEWNIRFALMFYNEQCRYSTKLNSKPAKSLFGRADPAPTF